MKMFKPCCENLMKHPDALQWNPYNKLFQCHCCGKVWKPFSWVDYFLNRIFKREP